MDQTLVDDNYWFIQLATNLLSYSLILLPSALLVYLVNNGLCHRSVSDNYLVKLFVYGGSGGGGTTNKDIHNNIIGDNDDDDNDRLLPVTIDTAVNNGRQQQNKLTKWWSQFGGRRATLMLYCFAGLQVSYLSWGLLQEKIMTTEYTFHYNILNVDDINHPSNSGLNPTIKSSTYHQKFTNSQFLVLVNRVLAFIIAFVALNIRQRSPTNRSRYGGGQPPLHQYIYCSLSNILSSWCQYEALKFVSFPTQVLSKACKIMPVMLMSQLIGGKKYRTVEYLFAISISFGMTLFLWTDRSANASHAAAAAHHSSADAAPLASESGSGQQYYGGLLILILYLTFDSFTSNWQTVLFDKYKMSTLHMMAGVNFFSILLTSTSLLEQGDLGPAFQMVVNNTSLLTDCLLLSMFSAAGQLFVFYTISTFGALVFVTIMTLRQAIAILLSCIVYNHSLAPVGLIGIIIVFATLFTQIYWKSKSKGKR
ncbi:adenosine 3'-phospho 5'-phosphosulfate transporter 1-like [Oppia nitens]|uniref:adenosine 3'-phospho 5'-phosphosulfate transporter 1-like n=1 Tax=Oppia nitens TaxID=1686743 RepID=UPI0023DC9875|nr:adenosine 3'-phospho 5'-phosphosulfate transporter 1-like [Oppia nitens]